MTEYPNGYPVGRTCQAQVSVTYMSSTVSVQLNLLGSKMRGSAATYRVSTSVGKRM